MKPLRIECLGLALLVLTGPLRAQIMRDPTLPPQASGAHSAVSSKPRDGRAPWALLFIDGKPNLVVGTRLYTEGQQLGAARIERITETEVWLRERGQLRKVSNYPSVHRRSVTVTPKPCATDDVELCPRSE
jgi:hypothetical protein